MTKVEEKLKKLNELFGSYRAEWLRGKIFDLFTEPSYFLGLKDHRPCVLQGGRGTGKTTVLRGLSYQGQYTLLNNDINEFNKNNFIGIYHRVNTNHVRAFCGGEIESSVWDNMFTHYFSLLLSREILHFVHWHKSISDADEVLSSSACLRIARSAHIENDCSSFDKLLESFEDAMYKFQAQINNISKMSLPKLSLPGDPLKVVTEAVIKLSQFKDKIFYILLDEYENYTDSQQQIVNTFIKHNTEYYTFKIGVRELGWRIKHTLNKEETLYDPADYILIDINNEMTEDQFVDFAKNVCQPRIKELFDSAEDSDNFSITESLQSLSMDKEAELLGIKNHEYLSKYKNLPSHLNKIVEDLSPLYCFFLYYWTIKQNSKLHDTIEDFAHNSAQWNSRFENYKYEMLFKIRKGRGMVGIQKYYAGWHTYVKLANGNIRYLMELVYRAYEKHLIEEKSLNISVSFESQTLAAQEVGKKNLMELEGLWKNGAQLTKLLLGFGRIFNVLCSEMADVSPEINQLSITGKKSGECDEIITAAVMNLALIRIPGNKLSGVTNTREYLYAIHPIYAPYFVFSYRRKRKISVSGQEFLGVITEPQKYIKIILTKKRIVLDSIDLPSQLSLFEDYYTND